MYPIVLAQHARRRKLHLYPMKCVLSAISRCHVANWNATLKLLPKTSHANSRFWTAHTRAVDFGQKSSCYSQRVSASKDVRTALKQPVNRKQILTSQTTDNTEQLESATKSNLVELMQVCFKAQNADDVSKLLGFESSDESFQTLKKLLVIQKLKKQFDIAEPVVNEKICSELLHRTTSLSGVKQCSMDQLLVLEECCQTFEGNHEAFSEMIRIELIRRSETIKSIELLSKVIGTYAQLQLHAEPVFDNLFRALLRKSPSTQGAGDYLSALAQNKSWSSSVVNRANRVLAMSGIVLKKQHVIDICGALNRSTRYAREKVHAELIAPHVIRCLSTQVLSENDLMEVIDFRLGLYRRLPESLPRLDRLIHAQLDPAPPSSQLTVRLNHLYLQLMVATRQVNKGYLRQACEHFQQHPQLYDDNALALLFKTLGQLNYLPPNSSALLAVLDLQIKQRYGSMRPQCVLDIFEALGLLGVTDMILLLKYINLTFFARMRTQSVKEDLSRDDVIRQLLQLTRIFVSTHGSSPIHVSERNRFLEAFFFMDNSAPVRINNDRALFRLTNTREKNAVYDVLRGVLGRQHFRTRSSSEGKRYDNDYSKPGYSDFYVFVRRRRALRLMTNDSWFVHPSEGLIYSIRKPLTNSESTAHDQSQFKRDEEAASSGRNFQFGGTASFNRAPAALAFENAFKILRRNVLDRLPLSEEPEIERVTCSTKARAAADASELETTTTSLQRTDDHQHLHDDDVTTLYRYYYNRHNVGNDEESIEIREKKMDTWLKLVVPSKEEVDSVTGEPLGRLAMLMRDTADLEYVTVRLVTPATVEAVLREYIDLDEQIAAENRDGYSSDDGESM